MSERVRMTQVIDGVSRSIRVPVTAIGVYSASGWDVDDSPEPEPAPKPSPKPRKPAGTPEPAPTPAAAAGTPDSTTSEQE